MRELKRSGSKDVATGQATVIGRSALTHWDCRAPVLGLLRAAGCARLGGYPLVTSVTRHAGR